MPQAPLPESLPGDFFVLEYNPDTQAFVLHLDDEDGSSYRFGTLGTINRMQLQFRLWGLDPKVSDRAIDAAKEFHSVQCIWKQDRVINLIDRKPDKPLVFKDGEENRNAYAHL